MVTPSPLIEIAGPPRQRGQDYGRLAAGRIHLGIRHYLEQLHRKGFGKENLCVAVEQYLPSIEAFDASYVDEMRGIAEGAGVDFEEVVLLNARTEVLQLAERYASGQDCFRDSEPDGCTGAVALPKVTRDGFLIHAQNWDWKAECAETTVVLRIRREGGPDVLTFTEAGGLARCGFNSAGIAITGNYLECERDYRGLGVPLALIRRKVLEQEHLALAMRAVYVTNKSASNNMIVSHAHGIAIDFECAPDETFLIHPESGLIVHANHWQSTVALSKLRDTGIESTPDSLYRDILVREALQTHNGALTTEHFKHALLDDFATPWAVCRPPSKSVTSSNLGATVATIVMQPAKGEMEIAMLPATDPTFTTYSLLRDHKVTSGSAAS